MLRRVQSSVTSLCEPQPAHFFLIVTYSSVYIINFPHLVQNIRPESREIVPLITVVLAYVTLLLKCVSVAEGQFVSHTELVA